MLGSELLVRAAVRLHEVLVGCFCFTPVLARQLADGVLHSVAFPNEADHAGVDTVAVVVALIRADINSQRTESFQCWDGKLLQ